MIARLVLGLYVAALFALTSVHDVRILLAAFLLWCALAGRAAPRLLRKTVIATGLFTLTVTAAALVVGALRAQPDVDWALRTNLRVLVITSLTLLTFERVDLARAVAPWPALSMVLTVAGAQIRILQRELDDLRLGLASRTTRRARASTVVRHAGGTGAHFLGRAMHDAQEIGLAMQARGAWRDRDA